MIRFHCVTRTYGSRVAVDSIDLELARGELFALLGHNGAGKTTTIKMLVGLLRPTDGRIEVGPYDVAKNPRKVSLRSRKRPCNVRVNDFSSTLFSTN